MGSYQKEPYSKYLTFNQFNTLFQRELTYQIFFDDYESDGFELTSEIIDTLNFMLYFDESDIKLMKPLLLKHFEECAANTTYGGQTSAIIEKHKQDYLAANKEVFGIYNEDQAWEAATLKFVTIDESVVGEQIHTNLSLGFDIPWDIEHGISLLFHNKVFSGVE